jgi:PAS domain S-box-containing protein
MGIGPNIFSGLCDNFGQSFQISLMKQKIIQRLNITIAFALAISISTYLLLEKLTESSNAIILGVALLGGFSFLYFLLFRKFLSPLLHFAAKTERAAHNGNVREIETEGIQELEPVVHLLHQQEQIIGQAVNHIGALNRQTSDEDSEEQVEHPALAEALDTVRKEMKEIARQEQERNWATQGLARFIDILRSNNQDISKLGDAIISELVNYLKANQGGLFIKNKEGAGDEYLELIACYAYERKKHFEKRVDIGEGLLGQAVLEKEHILLTVVPPQYVKITSGLGKATPRCLLIVPLKINDEVFGVLELAAFQPFQSYQIDFLNKLGESIASTIANTRASEQNRRLLEESHMQTEQMRAQEEEMRQNMEELQATQEEMQRAQRENQRMLSELEQVKAKLQEELKAKVGEIESQKARADIFLNTTQDAILYLDEAMNITFINRGGEKMFSYQPEQLQGKALSTIIQCTNQNLLEDYLSKAKQLGNSCEYIGKSNMYGFTFPISMAITEGTVNEQKVYTAIIRNIQKQKEQENRMQKAVNSAKEVHDRLLEREQQFRQIEQELARIRQEVAEKDHLIAQLHAGKP